MRDRRRQVTLPSGTLALRYGLGFGLYALLAVRTSLTRVVRVVPTENRAILHACYRNRKFRA